VRRRRSFLVGSLGLLVAPLVAKAQPAGTLPRIGYLGVSSSATDAEPFRRRLRELGWVDGHTIRIEYRWTEGTADRLPELVAELIRLKVDIIYTPGSNAAARAAKQATTTTPIVFTTPTDPVRVGLVATLSRPGGNVTGIGGGIQSSKLLALLKESLPRVSRVAILLNRLNPGHGAVLRDVGSTAGALGIQLHPVKASGPTEIESAFSEVTRGRVGALVVLGDPLFLQERLRVVAFAAQGRLPAIYNNRAYAAAGGLMAYEEDRSDVPRRAAEYVDRIQGVKPADLPVELPTKFRFVVNLKTARALGLTVPPSVLARADEILE
jgi:putative ABC transport system substrate-binding protein